VTSDAGLVGAGRVVAVALLLLLAGCSGLGGDDDPDRPAFDVPPTTTEAAPGEESDPFPYGVNESGITSSFALLQSHVGLLRLESFRVVRERTVRTDDLDLVRLTRVDARVDADRLRYLVEIDRRGEAGAERQVVYAPTEESVDTGRTQGSVTAVALDDEQVQSATRVEPLFEGSVPPRRVLSSPPSYRDRLYRYLAAVESARVERLDSGSVRITATETTNEDRVDPGPGTVSDLSVAVTVDSEGLITAARASYALTRNGSTVRVTERIAYSDVGSVSITPPTWYDRVQGTVTSSVTPGGGLIDVGNRSRTPGSVGVERRRGPGESHRDRGAVLVGVEPDRAAGVVEHPVDDPQSDTA